MNGFSPKFPLRFDYAGGAYQLTKTYTEMIRQNLKNLLLTNPGERVMDTKFGAGLRSYFFEPMTTATYSNIAENIEQQVEKYMPFVEIEGINFSGGDDLAGTANVLAIEVAYKVIPTQTTDSITIQESAESF
tara:strand:+ start:446 stop:841 length:396 start_codon:yes stop_codon:yes gene_type:complete